MDRFTDHETFRQSLVDRFRKELFGPVSADSDEEKNERLPMPPLQLYATGVLFPQRAVQDLLEGSSESEDEIPEDDPEISEDLADATNEDTGKKSGGISDEGASTSEAEPLNLANEFSPSAAGVSLRIAEPTRLSVRVSFGTYHTEQYSEPNFRAGQTALDGSIFPDTRDVTGYRRTHHDTTLTIDVPDVSGPLKPIDVGDPELNLKLHLTVRKRSDGTYVVSVMAVNHKVMGDRSSPDTRDAIFQIFLEIRDPDGNPIFLPIDRDLGNTSEDELASMELLYRHRRAFALGHGVAGDWNRDEALSETGVTDMVCASSIPIYDLKPIRPRERAFDSTSLNLSMRFLYEGSGGEEPEHEIVEALEALAGDYGSWIIAVEEEISTLTGNLKEAADRHIENCRQCLTRILRGIEFLKTDGDAMLAFRLMNKAMLVQQFHSSVLKHRELGSEFPSIPEGYRDLPGGERKWRPFQLAFVLMNVASMANEEDPERAIVDLIWFPTGGGKTEAYLGLAAYTICLERLVGSEGNGTVVLMRYTLRLLTAQQFQRAAALMLALEMMRRQKDLHADLGDVEISIGLWVGMSLSPNKRADARSKIKEIRQNEWASNPFQVLECPWCAVDFTDKAKLGYVEESKFPDGPTTVLFRCPDERCDFGGENTSLPICVIDEDIFDNPPTLVIGTVDKFAQIAWDNRVGRLFGLGGDASPPSLIIQDELHLISGPLGTIVGLYETAIDRLCSRGDRIHKIVASTATIRRAKEQCENLYHRDTFEFPPQGIRAGESYFAYEDTESPGRLYVGFMGTAVKSHQTALVRSCSSLLQGVCYDPEVDPPEHQAIADPYGTLVWYFNSLRELGHAATLSTGDIPEFLKGLCHRYGVPPNNRRYLRPPVELTSRRNADEIPEILQQLEIPWRMQAEGRQPVDVLLATNMIAVGVDVPRLGLFLMSGQPKSTSEYIQATSRVGRLYPGLVVTVYTQTKSRDRSHYERFVAYHQSIYKHVEPTSVTPFSPQARDRGMRGVLVALGRLLAGADTPDMLPAIETKLAAEVDFIVKRIAGSEDIRGIDPDEAIEAEEELREWVAAWKKLLPPVYGRMAGKVEDTTLCYPFGSTPDPEYQRNSWPIMTSMRNVDGACSAQVLNTYDVREPDVEGEAQS
jgi:hypothetical protein